MNPGTSVGRMPENVFDSERAIVIAGLANEGTLPAQPAAQSLNERYGGIEVRSADWTQQPDQYREHRDGGACIGEQRDGCVAP